MSFVLRACSIEAYYLELVALKLFTWSLEHKSWEFRAYRLF